MSVKFIIVLMLSMIMLYAYLTFASPEPQKEMVVIERDVTKLPENAFKN